MWKGNFNILKNVWNFYYGMVGKNFLKLDLKNLRELLVNVC